MGGANKLLDLAVGGSDGTEQNVRMSIAPPEQMLQDASSNQLKRAAVQVEQGSWNFESGKFVSPEDVNPADNAEPAL